MILLPPDERTDALHALAEDAPAGSRYVPGKYLFTRQPIGGRPEVVIVLPPRPPLTAKWTGPWVMPFKHLFNAHRCRDWWGYFYDEDLGRGYARWSADQEWWRRWVAYLLGGPRP